MPTQYTPILKLALPVQGELDGTWGDTVNDSITSMVEQAVAGSATITTWTANVHTLTTANGATSEARCAMLIIQTGAGGTALTAAGQVICPTATKLYVLKNDSAYTVTLKTAAGSGVAVLAGAALLLFCDGTNVQGTGVSINDVSGLAAGIATFLTTPTSANLRAAVTDETGTGALVFANSPTLTSPTFSGGTANGVLYLNGSQVASSGAALTFDGTYLTANGLRLAGTDTTNTIYQATGALGISTGSASGITFATNSTARMALDASGNLGVGTTSPGVRLDVAGATRIRAGNAIFLQNAAADNNATISCTGGSGNNTMSFNSGAMALDGSGNLGIGTTSPGVRLHVNEGNIRAGSTLAGAGLGVYEFSYTGSASLAAIEAVRVTNNTTSHLLFSTASSGTLAERMRLDASGNLGIGTTSPGAKLDVAGSARAGGLTATNSTIVGGASQTTVDSLVGTASRILAWGPNTTTPGKLYLGTVSSDASVGSISSVVLDASGNLGIGTTSPTRKLEVVGFSAALAMSVQTTGAGEVARFSDGTAQTLILGTTASGVYYNNANNGLHAWLANGTERMSLDATGNLTVGFNGDSLQHVFRVYGDAGANKAPAISLFRSSSREIVLAVLNNGALGFINSTGIGNFNDSTLNAATQMSLSAGGNVGIGTASPTTKLDVNGTVTATTFAGSASGLTNVSVSSASGILAVANGGTGVGTSTGTGSVVLSNSPTLVTPALGAATATTQAVGTNNTTVATTAYVKDQLIGGPSQSWQNVVGARAINTTYTNSTNRTIIVQGHMFNSGGGVIQMLVDGVSNGTYTAASGAPQMPFHLVVPPSSTYQIQVTAGTVSTDIWRELR